MTFSNTDNIIDVARPNGIIMLIDKEKYKPQEHNFVNADCRQIAKAAGVSPATVSRVIHQPEIVKPETRKRVLAAMKHFSYTPNFFAQLLTGKRSNTIGLFVRTLSPVQGQTPEESHVDYMVRCIIAYASACNYHSLVSLISDKDDVRTHSKITEVFYQKRIDAGIFIGFPDEYETIELLVSQGFCVGVFDQNVEGKNEPNRIVVNYDDLTGESAVDYLVSLGHRKIAALHGDLARYNGLQKYEGFLRGMKKNGLSIPDIWNCFTDFSLDEAYRQTAQMLSANSDYPTAIVATNDPAARSAITAITEQGLSVPEDISVIGIDDTLLSNFTNPPLTTFRINHRKMLELLAEKVIEYVEKPFQTQFTAVFDSVLIERSTCKRLA